MDLFKLRGVIDVDNTNAKKQLNDTSQEGEKAQSKLSKAFSSIGKGAAVVGKAIGTGLAVGGAAMGALTVKALNLSGELEQNMGGSEAVFKEYAGKMQETAKNAFANMGLSTSDFLATANKMGALFQGAGFDIAESSDLASSAMQRAADVASIMGIDKSAAMEAIAGAAKGNFTMMDNLGVAMNDTTLNAYALEKGIGKTTQEMTNQEKIGLAMEMFMEKTAYAAGNYAKENETLAGSLGTAKAALTNFLDGSGSVEDLVSSFGNLANVIIRNLQELAPRLINGLVEIINQITPMLPGLIQQLLPIIISGSVSLIQGVVAALPMLISVLVNDVLPGLISAVETIFNEIVLALPGLIKTICDALPVLLPMLINSICNMIVMLCENLNDIIMPIIDALPSIIISVVQALCENTPALIDGIITLVMGIVLAIPQIIQGLVDATPTIIELILTALLSNLPKIIGGLIQVVWGIVTSLPQIFGSLIEGVCNIFVGIWNALGNVFGKLGEWLGEVFAPVGEFFANLWKKIKEIWDGICNVINIALKLIGSIISAAFQIITLPFRFIWENCKEYVFAAWEWIKEKVSVAINAVKDVINTVMIAIKNFIEPIWNGIKDTVSTVVNAIKNVVSTAFNAVKDKVSSIFNSVKSTVSNIFNSIKTTISNVVNSIKTTVTNIFNNIKDAMSKPIEKARDLIKGIVDKIKGFFSGMKISFPKIKMPHFSVSPKGWKIGDLLKGSIPKLGIDWYAKAMNSPMIMNKPTIFGYDPKSGNMQAGGEAGSEMVGGVSAIMNMISAAVASQMDNVAYYLQRLIEMLAEYFPEILEAMDRPISFDPEAGAAAMAVPMDRHLGIIKKQKERGR